MALKQLELETRKVEAAHKQRQLDLELQQGQTKQLEIQRKMAADHHAAKQSRLATGGTLHEDFQHSLAVANLNKEVTLPTFAESDPHLFFNHFEKVATSLARPENKWVARFQSWLT